MQELDFLRYCDRIFYAELIPVLQSSELRQLAAAHWLKKPEQIDYLEMLPLLPKRKRATSNALKAAQALAKSSKLQSEGLSPNKESDGESGEEV